MRVLKALPDTGILRAALEDCDAAALANVRSGAGGPFAAALHVHDTARGLWQAISAPCGNAVLKSGLPTAHGEDQAIAPAHQEKLRDVLHRVGADHAHVYLVTSGEPCPACHAKLEILARVLVHEGSLLPGRFTVVYGASYEDTAAVAGFDDAAYHQDMQKKPGTGLLRQRAMAMNELPLAVRDLMISAAAVVESGDFCATGNGPMPEVAAIKDACRMQLAAHDPAPWDLRGATLYTATETIGPLAYAEALWANVTHWVSVQGAGEQTREAPDIGNDALFSIVATRPYTHEDSALSFLHITPFANLAQQEWRRLAKAGEVRDYNGA